MAITPLPAELWSSICQYLDRSSLRNLSIVDHHFRSIAKPLLFNEISIQPSQAAELKDFLKQTNYDEHIRVLEIYRKLKPTLHRQDTSSNPISLHGYWADYTSPQNAQAQDSSWQPIADLLRSFPALTDLIWTCPQEFPRCLLRILHDDQRFANCRLHVRTFRLRSLDTKEAALDAHELELLQSPNLHSVWFRDEDVIATGTTRIPEAVMCAARVAPNLRIARVGQEIIQMNPMRGYVAPPAKHQALESLVSNCGSRRARLEELQFTGYGPSIDAEQIIEWSECTDFSVLRTLVLATRFNNEVLGTLAGYDFACLERLSLDLEIEPGMMSLPEDRTIDTASGPARDFLCGLPPLKRLKLMGEINHEYLREVLVHHGPQLRALHLKALGFSPHRLSLLPTEVEWIGQNCQRLQELSVQMLRSHGDADEVAAYTSLGSMPTLQTLDLKLDASDYTALRNEEGIEEPDPDPDPRAPILAPAREHFDDFDREFGGFSDYGCLLDPLKGHLKDTLINAVLDRDLEESTFARVTEAKAPRILPFDRIEIQTLGGGDFGKGRTSAAVAEVVEEIQSRWLYSRDCSSGEVSITELEYSQRSRLTRTGDKLSDEGELDPRVAVIFRSIWPERAKGSDWRKDWHSFSLAS